MAKAKTPILAEREIINLLKEAGLSPAHAAQFHTWAKYMAGQAEMLEKQAKEQVFGAIVKSADKDLIDMAAEARTLARNLSEAQVRAVGETIARAIDAGVHPHEAARWLDDIKGLDPQRARRYLNYLDELAQSGLSDEQIERMGERFWAKMLRERKELIANTEMNNAFSKYQREKALSEGATGKYWITTGDMRVTDECQMNEAAGVIGINEDFPSGHETTPRFPGCRCSVAYVYDSEQWERAQADADEHIALTAEAKED